MRGLVVNQLKAEFKKFQCELEKLEAELSVFSNDFLEEKKIKKLAKMIYTKQFNEDRRKFDEAD